MFYRTGNALICPIGKGCMHFRTRINISSSSEANDMCFRTLGMLPGSVTGRLTRGCPGRVKVLDDRVSKLSA